MTRSVTQLSFRHERALLVGAVDRNVAGVGVVVDQEGEDRAGCRVVVALSSAESPSLFTPTLGVLLTLTSKFGAWLAGLSHSVRRLCRHLFRCPRFTSVAFPVATMLFK